MDNEQDKNMDEQGKDYDPDVARDENARRLREQNEDPAFHQFIKEEGSRWLAERKAEKTDDKNGCCTDENCGKGKGCCKTSENNSCGKEGGCCKERSHHRHSGHHGRVQSDVRDRFGTEQPRPRNGGSHHHGRLSGLPKEPSRDYLTTYFREQEQRRSQQLRRDYERLSRQEETFRKADAAALEAGVCAVIGFTFSAGALLYKVAKQGRFKELNEQYEKLTIAEDREPSDLIKTQKEQLKKEARAINTKAMLLTLTGTVGAALAARKTVDFVQLERKLDY